jgi:hypothetical protein
LQNVSRFSYVATGLVVALRYFCINKKPTNLIINSNQQQNEKKILLLAAFANDGFHHEQLLQRQSVGDP